MSDESLLTMSDESRALAKGIAARVADQYREFCQTAEAQGGDVKPAAVAVAAIGRAASYFDQMAIEILESGAEVDPTTDRRQLQGLLGAVAQALGASLFLAELLPREVLETLWRSGMRAIHPDDRETEISR